MNTGTIHLDGEVDTTPDETHAQAAARLVTNEANNLCELVGYYGFVNPSTILIETRETRCRLEYDTAGILQRALVGTTVVWQRRG